MRGIGLTDNGLIPLLRALRHKDLNLLDVSDNIITDKSLQVLDGILADPSVDWKHVRLGQVQLTPKRAKSLARHKHTEISVTPIQSHKTKITTLMHSLLGNELA